ncbi:VHS domain-containing protein [Myxozyma melibiosi]|uniref:VHS domain-containing protein n=1 Tax=Myxozyma melibiosi TaxID=54550 RepID=A0ABR1F0L9_9ASCO
MSSFGRYSDTGGGPSRHESYSERFRVQDSRLSAAGPAVHRSDAPERSRLSRLIDRACDPSNLEPNLALNLEIADLINEKKGNSAREAASQIVKLINSRSSAISILALALLDICVKNCGYPFHLQISRKEFLNELVRKFPERPPPRYSRTQQLILESIEEWRETICQTSRYKDDLGYIRDMHRLLAYKGYSFPEINRDDAAVLNPSDNIKSAEELEEEERDAQAAKLQELIRRGTPADLLEANHLMKIMAGYDTEHRTDYRAKAAEDLAKIQRKAKLLDEMLDGVRNGDAIGRQDAFEELYNAIKSSQPKIQKIIKEESDDADAVQRLLGLNDYINTVITKYETVKSTRRPGSSASSSTTPSRTGSPTVSSPTAAKSSSTAASAAPAAAVNLIDFDDEIDVSQPPIFLSTSPAPGASTASSTSTTPAAFSNELFASVVPQSSQSQSPSSPPLQQQQQQQQHLSTESILAQFRNTTISSPAPMQPSNGMQFANLLNSTPSPQQPQQPNNSFAAFQALSSSSLSSSAASPAPASAPQMSSQSVLLPATNPTQSAMQPTPSPAAQQQQAKPAASSNLLDLEGLF